MSDMAALDSLLLDTTNISFSPPSLPAPASTSISAPTTVVSFIHSNIPNEQNEKPKKKDKTKSKKMPKNQRPNKKRKIVEKEPDDDQQYEVEGIESHVVYQGVSYWYIKWLGYALHDNSWEPRQNLEFCQEMLVDFRSKKSGHFKIFRKQGVSIGSYEPEDYYYFLTDEDGKLVELGSSDYIVTKLWNNIIGSPVHSLPPTIGTLVMDSNRSIQAPPTLGQMAPDNSDNDPQPSDLTTVTRSRRKSRSAAKTDRTVSNLVSPKTRRQGLSPEVFDSFATELHSTNNVKQRRMKRKMVQSEDESSYGSIDGEQNDDLPLQLIVAGIEAKGSSVRDNTKRKREDIEKDSEDNEDVETSVLQSRRKARELKETKVSSSESSLSDSGDTINTKILSKKRPNLQERTFKKLARNLARESKPKPPKPPKPCVSNDPKRKYSGFPSPSNYTNKPPLRKAYNLSGLNARRSNPKDLELIRKIDDDNKVRDEIELHKEIEGRREAHFATYNQDVLRNEFSLLRTRLPSNMKVGRDSDIDLALKASRLDEETITSMAEATFSVISKSFLTADPSLDQMSDISERFRICALSITALQRCRKMEWLSVDNAIENISSINMIFLHRDILINLLKPFHKLQLRALLRGLKYSSAKVYAFGKGKRPERIFDRGATVILDWKTLESDLDGVLDLAELISNDEEITLMVHPITIVISRLYLLFLDDIRKSRQATTSQIHLSNAKFVLNKIQHCHYFLDLVRNGSVQILSEDVIGPEDYWKPFLHRPISQVVAVEVPVELYKLPIIADPGPDNDANQIFTQLLSIEDALLAKSYSILQKENIDAASTQQEHVRRILRLRCGPKDDDSNGTNVLNELDIARDLQAIDTEDVSTLIKRIKQELAFLNRGSVSI